MLNHRDLLSGETLAEQLSVTPDLDALESITAAAFGQRRKMLRSSLKGLGGGALCEKAGISPDARAEVIDLAGFLALARASLGQASA